MRVVRGFGHMNLGGEGEGVLATRRDMDEVVRVMMIGITYYYMRVYW